MRTAAAGRWVRMLEWLGPVAMTCAMACAPVGMATAREQPAARPSILYFETIGAASPGLNGSLKTSAPSYSFDAYGRHFDLQLEANDRIASPVALAKTGSLRLLRGAIKGSPGSWVRLATVDGNLRGMIWDGSQMFLIEPSAAVRDSLVPPLIAPVGETVIFRLADTLVAADGAMCEAPAPAAPMSGDKAYDAMVQELGVNLKSIAAAAPTAIASKRLEISALGDALFRAQYASDEEAIEEILIRINYVDGIYTSQLRVAIQAPTVDVTATATQSLDASTDPSTLLVSLAQVRKNSAALNTRGLTHLFTGRDLDGTTVGIAYRDSLCRKEFGVALTETRGRGSWFEALIAAHEIGHNFGAVHDGEAPGSSSEPNCSSTPAGQFLMSSSVDKDHSTFSQCSLNTIQPKIAAATCVSALSPADLSVPPDLGSLHQGVSRSFQLLVPVTNVGGVTATGTHAQLVLPPSLVIEDVFVEGGTCTSGAGAISCVLGDMAGGTTRQINLQLRGNTLGSNSFSVQVTATSDAQTNNNSGSGTIFIDPETDLGVDLQAPTTGLTDVGFEAGFTVTNLASIASGDVTVDIDLPAGTTASSATANGATCAIQTSLVRCSLPALAAKGSATGSVSLSSKSVGAALLRVRVTSTSVDPNTANDSSERTVAIAAPVIPTANTSAPVRRSGGGDTGLLLLMAFASIAAVRSQLAGRSRRQY